MGIENGTATEAQVIAAIKARLGQIHGVTDPVALDALFDGLTAAKVVGFADGLRPIADAVVAVSKEGESDA